MIYYLLNIVSKDKSKTIVFGIRILNLANSKDENIFLDGLDKTVEYVDVDTGEHFGGDELMFKGLMPIYANEDFATFVKVLSNK